MFKERLKKLRTSKNLTQEQIARKLRIARASYTRYETGEREPSFETIIELSELFNVSIDYLLGKINEPTPPLKVLITSELFGDRLKKIREYSGKSQNEVAKALNVTILEINNWERNISNVNRKNMEKLCELYGISMRIFRDTVISENLLTDKKQEFNQQEIDILIDMEKIYFALNQIGQNKLFDYANDLLDSNKYKR